LKPSIEQDRRSDKRLAVYKQEAKPFKIFDEGTINEYAVPTGPSVAVTARFDAATGLPQSAIVGGRIYTYRIEPLGGGEPILSPSFREAIDATLKREAALNAAIKRERQNRR